MAATPAFRITRIKDVLVPATSPSWRWSTFVASQYQPDPCTTSVPDGYEALFTGIYPAKGPWENRLSATQNGSSIELAELR